MDNALKSLLMIVALQSLPMFLNQKSLILQLKKPNQKIKLNKKLSHLLHVMKVITQLKILVLPLKLTKQPEKSKLLIQLMPMQLILHKKKISNKILLNKHQFVTLDMIQLMVHVLKSLLMKLPKKLSLQTLPNPKLLTLLKKNKTILNNNLKIPSKKSYVMMNPFQLMEFVSQFQLMKTELLMLSKLLMHQSLIPLKKKPLSKNKILLLKIRLLKKQLITPQLFVKKVGNQQMDSVSWLPLTKLELPK